MFTLSQLADKGRDVMSAARVAVRLPKVGGKASAVRYDMTARSCPGPDLCGGRFAGGFVPNLSGLGQQPSLRRRLRRGRRRREAQLLVAG